MVGKQFEQLLGVAVSLAEQLENFAETEIYAERVALVSAGEKLRQHLSETLFIAFCISV